MKNNKKTHKWKLAKYNHVQENSTKTAKQILQEHKSKTLYTLEDGLVGRNM
jgi:hypothetical protein